MLPYTKLLVDPSHDLQEHMGFFKKKGYHEKLKEVKELLLQTYSKKFLVFPFFCLENINEQETTNEKYEEYIDQEVISKYNIYNHPAIEYF
jgi:hypothetical protein